jgi:hypothetical protein
MRGVTPISRFIRGPDWRLDLAGLTDPAVAVPLIGFVNGLSLLVIELKKPGVVLVQRAAHRLERHGRP